MTHLISFMLGANFGIMVICLCKMAKKADERLGIDEERFINVNSRKENMDPR